MYRGKLWKRLQLLLRPPLPPPSAPPISTPSIQKEFPEEFSPFAKRCKFKTRIKTIVVAMARDDVRDGAQGGEGRDRQEEKIVSPKRLVADIWHLLSYHSISKLPGMVWYGMAGVVRKCLLQVPKIRMTLFACSPWTGLTRQCCPYHRAEYPCSHFFCLAIAGYFL